MIISSPPPPSSPTFHHLLDGFQRNAALQQDVFGPWLLSSAVMQSSQYPRVLVQQLGVLTGQLCGAFLQVPLDASEQQAYFAWNIASDANAGEADDDVGNGTTTIDPAIPKSMVHVLLGLIQLAYVLKIDLHWAILQKMELNNRKYPVDLCKVRVVVFACVHVLLLLLCVVDIDAATSAHLYRHFWMLAFPWFAQPPQGKAGKYTAYSQVTGITKTEGQSTSVYRPTPQKAPRITTSDNGSPTSVVDPFVNQNDDNDMDDDNSIAALQLRIRQFALDRQWQQYHQPRNLVLALMGEFGELAELFQWRHEDDLMKWDDDGEDKEDIVMKDDIGTSTPETTTTTEASTTATTTSTMARLCRDKVQQEIADVAIYLLRLADVCNIALDQCAWQTIIE